MKGLASYRWAGNCPSRPNRRVDFGAFLAAFLMLAGLAGCSSESAPEPAKPVAKPEAELESESPPVAIEAVPAETKEEEEKSDTPAGIATPEETETATKPTEKPSEKEEEEVYVEEEKLVEAEPLPEPENGVRLSPTEDVWINRDEKKVYVGGLIALRRGMLEMFACTKGTKEHESIVSVNSKAATVHAALLAVGAIPGTPVSFDPEYKPPTGTEIDITIEWKDPEGKWQSANAREWVRNVRTKKELDVPWVFGGSGFYVDEEGKQHYLAEGGDLICVSNFSSATLDLPVESSQAEAGLLFDAFTDRVPALGTPVRLVLTPKLEP